MLYIMKRETTAFITKIESPVSTLFIYALPVKIVVRIIEINKIAPFLGKVR